MRAMGTKERAGKKLAKLRRWVHKAGNRGAMTRVMERFNVITGTSTARQQIERVLTLDDEKRVEPRFGAGLALMQIEGEMA